MSWGDLGSLWSPGRWKVSLHDGNRFIINVPGRGYSFVASVAIATRAKPKATRTAPRSASNPEHYGVPIAVTEGVKS